MKRKDIVQKIMDRPMSRKDFLKEIGLALLGLIGINAVISSLLRTNQQLHRPSTPSSPQSKSKFGNGKYGI